MYGQKNSIKSEHVGDKQTARFWNFSTLTYNASANIIIEPTCIGIMFTNIGDTIARVNGMVIFPSATPAASLGDSRSLSAHQLDMFKGNLTLSFNPGGAAPLVEVVQLYYLEDY